MDGSNKHGLSTRRLCGGKLIQHGITVFCVSKCVSIALIQVYFYESLILQIQIKLSVAYKNDDFLFLSIRNILLQ